MVNHHRPESGLCFKMNSRQDGPLQKDVAFRDHVLRIEKLVVVTKIIPNFDNSNSYYV